MAITDLEINLSQYSVIGDNNTNQQDHLFTTSNDTVSAVPSNNDSPLQSTTKGTSSVVENIYKSTNHFK